MPNPQRDDYPIVECQICLKEIPQSGAKAEEVCDYVAYFCGLECYQQWKQTDAEKSEATAKLK